MMLIFVGWLTVISPASLATQPCIVFGYHGLEKILLYYIIIHIYT